jgi:hypothetical protein
MSIAAVTAVVLRGREIQPIERAYRALLGSATLAIVILAIAWLSAAGSWDESPDAGAPFWVLTLFIIAGSFSMCAWFGCSYACLIGTDNERHSSSISKIPSGLLPHLRERPLGSRVMRVQEIRSICLGDPLITHMAALDAKRG